jgi:hypothetical protein
MLVTLLWISLLVALIIIIAVSCSLAVSECENSPVLVQKIMLRNDIDSETLSELENMFTQFKVMKIEFSACGMFRIDLPFLCGVFSATISYVIIFSQL